ncbi:MAG: aminopeptidase [Candidatus Thermoplasmatota archaeon]|nr:aminopeptidase [Candidatus Thermoplasmatota archaeon]MDI6856266.1 aminopeptidase [Candidatus Thermoplasmatota archaeon]
MGLQESAKTIISTCMGVRKGERAVIIIDTSKENIGQALFEAAKEVKAEPVLVKILPTKADNEEPPAAVAEAMKHADVIIAATEFSLTHTEARKAATRSGARIAALPGITEEIFESLSADFEEIEKRIKKIYWAVRNCRKIEIETKLGTYVTLSTDGRKWVTEDTGICRERSKLTNLPAGEIFIAPNEGSANGTLIVDGSFGKKLQNPLRIIVKDGFAESENEEAEKLLTKKGKLGRAVGEFGIGLNPKAKIIGFPLQDKKALGTCHLSFGDNFAFGGKIKCGAQAVAVIKEPTVKVDGRVILEEGKLVI